MPKNEKKVTKDLTIYPVKVEELEDPKWDTLDHRLPKPPFLLVLNAPCAGGKTTTIVNMLYNDNYYRDMFDSVVIFSPTIENDLTWQIAREDDKNTIITGEQLEQIDDLVETIYNIQLEKVKKAEEEHRTIPHLLMIIDDCLGLLGKKFARMCTRHRHPRVSVMVSTQDFRSLPVQCRQNASHYMIYRTHNKKELGKMLDEFAGMYGTDNFMRLYDAATDERFSFLVLHNRTVEAYKKFDTFLWSREEEHNEKEKLESNIHEAH